MVQNQIIGIIISVIFGLIVGSFLNVIILRFDDLRTVFFTRSHCMHCKKEIAWYDLFPFFSYLLLAGKCRNCKTPISMQYPLVEVGTAILFGLLFWKFGLTLQFGFLLAITAILVIVFTYDILHYLIADILIWIAIGLWVVYLTLSYFFIDQSVVVLLHSLYGGLILGGFLALLVLISKEKWMGAGDIKLGFLLGAICAWPSVLVGLFATFMIGSIVGLILIGTKEKKMKDMIPFAPFMITGVYLAIFVGEKIVDWYLGGLWM